MTNENKQTSMAVILGIVIAGFVLTLAVLYQVLKKRKPEHQSDDHMQKMRDAKEKKRKQNEAQQEEQEEPEGSSEESAPESESDGSSQES